LTFAGCSIRFLAVIRSFRNRALKRYFEAGDPSGLSVRNAARVSRVLRALDPAARPEEVNLLLLASAARRSALGDPGYRELAADHLCLG
jgi:hypothetical protein